MLNNTHMEIPHSNKASAPRLLVFWVIALFFIFPYALRPSDRFSRTAHAGIHPPDYSTEKQLEEERGASHGTNLVARNNAPLFQDLGGQNNPALQKPAVEKKNSRFGKKGVITVPVGNIYSRPTTGSSILERLKKGDAVTLVRKKDSWYAVMLYGGIMGWAQEHIVEESEDTSTDGGDALKEGKRDFSRLKDPFQLPSVTGDKLILMVDVGRVREDPSFNSDVTFTLKRGDTVSILDTKEGWLFFVVEDGRKGWAHESLFFETKKPPVDDVAGLKKIEDIRFEKIGANKDKVVFFLNGDNAPKTFAIENENPRVVCDFFDTHLVTDIKRNMKVNGSVVRRIRIGLHEGVSPKARVVLDLVPREGYHLRVRQVFFKDKKIFTLVVEQAL